MGFLGGSDGKESACHTGDVAGAVGLIPASRGSHGEGNSNPKQYSCLENSMNGILPGILQERILEWVAISFSNSCMHACMLSRFSRVQLCVTPWTAVVDYSPWGYKEIQSQLSN